MCLREDEWLTVRQLFNVDVELRQEIVFNDVGQNNVVLVPGTAAFFVKYSIHIVREKFVSELCRKRSRVHYLCQNTGSLAVLRLT